MGRWLLPSAFMTYIIRAQSLASPWPASTSRWENPPLARPSEGFLPMLASAAMSAEESVLDEVWRSRFVLLSLRTLFDSHGQDKCPVCLRTALPGLAIFQRYGALAFLECLESPYFFARSPWRGRPPFFRGCHVFVVYLFYHSLVTNLSRLCPPEAC
jgi:hypothetical protein